MIIVRAKDLDRKGILHRATSQLVLRNQMYVKGQSFSTHFRRAALDLCKSYQKSGLKCLLVDSGEHLTIWRQADLSRPDL